jgi:ubiquinone/menaquinone biosynthesis C-methylase UbiE
MGEIMEKSAVESHFDEVAKNYDFYKRKNKYYYDNLKGLIKSLIPQGKKIFEVGCGTGDLIITLKPSTGFATDLSGEMIRMAKTKYNGVKNIKFSASWPDGKYDYIFMSDVIEHLENPSETFKKISGLMDKDTVFICTMANPVWEPVLLIAEKLGLKMPEGKHSRLGFGEIEKILGRVGLKVSRHDYRLLVPIKIPLVTEFANRHLERYLKRFCFIEYFTAMTT